MISSTSRGAGMTIVPVPQRLLIFPSIFPILGKPLLSASFSFQVFFVGMKIPPWGGWSIKFLESRASGFGLDPAEIHIGRDVQNRAIIAPIAVGGGFTGSER